MDYGLSLDGHQAHIMLSELHLKAALQNRLSMQHMSNVNSLKQDSALPETEPFEAEYTSHDERPLWVLTEPLLQGVSLFTSTLPFSTCSWGRALSTLLPEIYTYATELYNGESPACTTTLYEECDYQWLNWIKLN